MASASPVNHVVPPASSNPPLPSAHLPDPPSDLPPPTLVFSLVSPPADTKPIDSQTTILSHSSASTRAAAVAGDSPSPLHSQHLHVSVARVAVISGIFGGAVALLVVALLSLIWRRGRRNNQPHGVNPLMTQWYSPQNRNRTIDLPPSAPPHHRSSADVLIMRSSSTSDLYSGHGQHCHHHHHLSSALPVGGIMISQFFYEELAAATNRFSKSNLLGQGGFGYVHKGVLCGGREVAVKSLKAGSGQGDREFRAEVEIISRIHHRHLVSLVGYCVGVNGQRMLVYEFVPNKTLEFHLHGKGRPVMDWATRLRIAVGSAKGLAYLHEDCHPRIIHRDIKAANILLDNNFEAMVADFGLAKLSSDEITHVSTRVMGTFGYLAPEYASSGKLTEKSDVFSYGVMLLELITGRRPVDLDPTSNSTEDSLVEWARPALSRALEGGDLQQVVEPRLEGKYDHQELTRMATCAAACIRQSAKGRPKMSQIVRALDGNSSIDDLNKDMKLEDNTLYNPNGRPETYDTNDFNADMMWLKKMVMSSEEFRSDEMITYCAISDYRTDSSDKGIYENT